MYLTRITKFSVKNAEELVRLFDFSNIKRKIPLLVA